ncbi:MAG: macro domain-containing protein, partial [Dehalococcoidales bacterium]
WQGGNRNEASILSSAYIESLRLAEKMNLTSISFPSISTGAYGYPLKEAANVAVNAIVKFAKEEALSIKEIIFVLFSDDAYTEYAESLEKVTSQ